MGHIELAVPVTHIWFYKCMPSRIGLMLDMSSRQLERVIYYEDYIVIDPGQTPLQQVPAPDRSRIPRSAGPIRRRTFRRRHGCRSHQDHCCRPSILPNCRWSSRKQMGTTRSKQIRKKLAKRLKLVPGLHAQPSTRPEWMMLEVLPVIPPDLRPLVPLEGGRFATSRSQRSLSPRHQPQQPAQKPAPAQDAGRHHPQRKAHAAGSGRCALRQRPSRPRRHRRRQSPAEVALRHAQGQGWTFPPEPARQARRLLRPFGHRYRSRAEASSVRSAEEDGARSVRAIHHSPAQGTRLRPHRPQRQEDDRAPDARSVGHPRRSDQGSSRAAEPRADAAPSCRSRLSSRS